MAVKPVGWFEIPVRDMERAKAFYERVFDIRLEALNSPDPDESMCVFPGQMDKGNGASGALVKTPLLVPGSGGAVVYFMSADCAIELARVPSNGGRIDKDKYPLGPYGFAALITDTEGNKIGLHSMK
ncbi:lactoylglutathione lyase [Alkalilimnicola ehrlichii]|uniref:Lactoylglutathione lyase n=1 Tax=Alkalilimnicola ehrlichii TaxID=351052 RepID=A0A3E0WYK8_9GAMM|nr:VOC family protein [Alkalilimnicola ehrlichii]RFA30524.1 lactoylglutathione lyase [Alkalilimnicola ehrlichii]RFA38072.1 lactoylglutathione lyase [Alkalilimnicola ehrlichii]